MSIYTIFPTEILVRDVPDLEQQWIREQVKPYLESAAWRQDHTRHFVETTYAPTKVNDIRDHGLQALQDLISENLVEYLAALGSEDSLELFESWSNRYSEGGYMSDHEHPGCKISGIYYYQAQEGSGDLWFRNPNPLMLNHIWPANSHSGLDCQRVPARTGRLVMFPGWLTHAVSTCKDSKISIAFNLR